MMILTVPSGITISIDADSSSEATDLLCTIFGSSRVNQLFDNGAWYIYSPLEYIAHELDGYFDFDY